MMWWRSYRPGKHRSQRMPCPGRWWITSTRWRRSCSS
jgi:hypothetical protein